MKTTIRTALPATLSVALVAGALAVPAIATTDDSTDGDGTEESTTEDSATEDAATDDVRGRRHRHPVAHASLHSLEEGELAERLAAELGLDTTTVQDAIDAVRDDLVGERLAEAVENDRLTQDQADRIAAAIEDDALADVMQEIRLEQLEARLAERVAAGDLTQEEADEMLDAAEAGEWPGRGFRRGGDRDRGGPRFAPDDDAASDDAETEADTTSL